MHAHKLVFLAIVALGLGAAQPQAYALTNEEQAALREQLQAVLKEHNTPALGVAVYDAQHGAWSTAVGLASVKEQRKATPDTVFRLGSVSKSFVALTAMRLEEEGSLRLQDPFESKNWSGVRLENRFATPVRVVHLLEHTAGLDDLQFAEYAYKKEGISLEDAFAFAGQKRTLRWAPGESMSYSNAGPAMVAYMIEKQGQKTFEEHSRELVLDPLHMSHTSWNFVDVMAEGHVGEHNEPVDYAHILFRPSGALNTTPEDMTHFLEFMVHEGRYQGAQLVSLEHMRRMRHPKTTLAARAGLDVGYGPGSQTFFSEQGHVLFGHGGAIDGFMSRYEYVPGKYGWAVLSNKQDSAGLKAAIKVLRAHFLVHPPERPPAIKIDSSAFEGLFIQKRNRMELMRFVSDLMGVTRISVEGDGLTASPLLGGSEPVHLIPIQETEEAILYRTRDASLASHVFFKDGGHYQELGMSFHEASPWVVWSKLCLFFFAMIWFALGLLACLIWAFKWWRKTLQAPRLKAIASLTVFCFWFWVASLLLPSFASDPLVALGTISPYSLAIFSGSTMFAGATGLLLGASIYTSRHGERIGVFIAMLAAASIWVVLYAMFYGWIGLRIWSF